MHMLAHSIIYKVEYETTKIYFHCVELQKLYVNNGKDHHWRISSNIIILYSKLTF